MRSSSLGLAAKQEGVDPSLTSLMKDWKTLDLKSLNKRMTECGMEPVEKVVEAKPILAFLEQVMSSKHPKLKESPLDSLRKSVPSVRVQVDKIFKCSESGEKDAQEKLFQWSNPTKAKPSLEASDDDSLVQAIFFAYYNCKNWFSFRELKTGARQILKVLESLGGREETVHVIEEDVLDVKTGWYLKLNKADIVDSDKVKEFLRRNDLEYEGRMPKVLQRCLERLWNMVRQRLDKFDKAEGNLQSERVRLKDFFDKPEEEWQVRQVNQLFVTVCENDSLDKWRSNIVEKFAKIRDDITSAKNNAERAKLENHLISQLWISILPPAIQGNSRSGVIEGKSQKRRMGIRCFNPTVDVIADEKRKKDEATCMLCQNPLLASAHGLCDFCCTSQLAIESPHDDKLVQIGLYIDVGWELLKPKGDEEGSFLLVPRFLEESSGKKFLSLKDLLPSEGILDIPSEPPVRIDLKSGECCYDLSQYRALPCVFSRQMLNGRPYLRFALLVPKDFVFDVTLQSRLPESLWTLNELSKLRKEFLKNSTNPEVVSFGELEERLAEMYPAAIYLCSKATIKAAGMDQKSFWKPLWKRLLQWENQYDTGLFREAKEAFFKLLTSRRARVFIVTLDHARHLSKLLPKTTKHSFHWLSVEQLNLQSVLRSIDSFNQSAATSIVAVHVTGELSPSELAQLLQRIKGVDIGARYLLIHFPQLLHSLSVSGLSADDGSVRIAASLKDSTLKENLRFSSASGQGGLVLLETNAMDEVSVKPSEEEVRLVREETRKRFHWALSSRDRVLVAVDGVEDLGEDVFSIDCNLSNSHPEKITTFQELVQRIMNLPAAKQVVFINSHFLSNSHRAFLKSTMERGNRAYTFVLPYHIPETERVYVAFPLRKSSGAVERTLRLLLGTTSLNQAKDWGLDRLSAERFELLSQEADNVDPKWPESAFWAKALLCVKGQGAEEDVAFIDFCSYGPSAQWLPQILRVQCWMQSFLSSRSFNVKEAFGSESFRLRNLSSIHLFSIFGPLAGSDSVVAGTAPSYNYVSSDGSLIPMVDLVLAQAVEGAELHWDGLVASWGQEFTLSLVYLMDLVLVYPYPLRILCLIQSRSLFRVMQSISYESYPEQCDKLVYHIFLTQKLWFFKQTLNHIHETIVVIKWALLSAGVTSLLSLNEEEIRMLVDLGVPIQLKDDVAEAYQRGHIRTRYGELLSSFGTEKQFNLRNAAVGSLLKLKSPEDFLLQNLRQFLCNHVFEEEEVGNFQIGAVAVHFCLHFLVQRDSKPGSLAKSYFFSTLAKWHQGDGDLSSDAKISEWIQKRFTQDAKALLLSHARTLSHLDSSKSVITPVDFSLEFLPKSHVVHLGCILEKKDFVLNYVGASSQTLLEAVWSALAGKMEPLCSLLKDENTVLIDETPPLCAAYERFIETQKVSRLFFDFARMTSRDYRARSFSLTNQQMIRFVYATLDTSLCLKVTEFEDFCQFLKTHDELRGFTERVAGDLEVCSISALYASEFFAFIPEFTLCKLKKSVSQPQRIRLLGNLEIKVQVRPVPLRIREIMLGLSKDPSQIPKLDDNCTPRISEGVSRATWLHNLSLLQVLGARLESFKREEWIGKPIILRSQMQFCLLRIMVTVCWFWSIGMKDIVRLNVNQLKQNCNKLLSNMTEISVEEERNVDVPYEGHTVPLLLVNHICTSSGKEIRQLWTSTNFSVQLLSGLLCADFHGNTLSPKSLSDKIRTMMNDDITESFAQIFQLSIGNKEALECLNQVLSARATTDENLLSIFRALCSSDSKIKFLEGLQKSQRKISDNVMQEFTNWIIAESRLPGQRKDFFSGWKYKASENGPFSVSPVVVAESLEDQLGRLQPVQPYEIVCQFLWERDTLSSNVVVAPARSAREAFILPGRQQQKKFFHTVSRSEESVGNRGGAGGGGKSEGSDWMSSVSLEADTGGSAWFIDCSNVLMLRLSDDRTSSFSIGEKDTLKLSANFGRISVSAGSEIFAYFYLQMDAEKLRSRPQVVFRTLKETRQSKHGQKLFGSYENHHSAWLDVCQRAPVGSIFLCNDFCLQKTAPGVASWSVTFPFWKVPNDRLNPKGLLNFHKDILASLPDVVCKGFEADKDNFEMLRQGKDIPMDRDDLTRSISYHSILLQLSLSLKDDLFLKRFFSMKEDSLDRLQAQLEDSSWLQEATHFLLNQKKEGGKVVKTGVINPMKTFFNPNPPDTTPPIVVLREGLTIREAQYDTLLAFVLHENIFVEIGELDPSTFSRWIVQILRSSLSEAFKKWFLSRVQVSGSMFLPPMMALSQEHFTAYCLAQSCPLEKARVSLLSNVGFLDQKNVKGEDVRNFLLRKDFRYGVVFCATSMEEKLKTVGIGFVVVSFDPAVEVYDMSLYYLQVISSFRENNFVVYVRGFDSIPDLFLKWLAEYTAKHPTRFIFIENCDIRYGFPENRDRCRFVGVRPALEGTGSGRAHIKEVIKAYEASELVIPTGVKVESQVKGNDVWESTVRELLRSHASAIILIVSPPGAGKTYFMENTIIPEYRHEGYVCELLDCSSDALVEDSLHSLLSSRFPHKGHRSMLVADEFHFLSPRHKRDMLNFIEGNVSWLKTVLLANRHSALDESLFEDLSSRVDRNIVAVPGPNVCRLSIDRILDVARKQCPNMSVSLVKFFQLWFRALRGMFGDEAISLRSIKSLYSIMSSEIVSCQALAELLREKIPSISELTALEFCGSMVERWNQLIDDAKLSVSAHSILIEASVVASERDLVTFPQFCEMPKVGAFRVPPVARLRAWVTLVHNDVKPEALNLIDKLEVIDQPGFPYVRSLEGGRSTNFVGYAKSGDYRDLHWMVATLTQGHALDWKAVAEVWKRNYVTDVRLLSDVISATSEKGACIRALEAENICALLEDGKDIKLAETVIRSLSPEKISVSNSPYWTACWALFRFNYASYLSLRALIDEFQLLCWASLNAYGLRSCAGDGKVLTDRLISMLRLYSHKDALDEENLHLLWGHQFSTLLRFGDEESDVHPVVGLTLARSSLKRGLPHGWPQEIVLLSKIYGGNGTLDDCKKLDETQFISVLRLKRAFCDAELSLRLCQLAGNVAPPVSFQKDILTCSASLDHLLVSDWSSILDRLSEGVRCLPEDQIVINGKEIKELLKARHVRLSEVEDERDLEALSAELRKDFVLQAEKLDDETLGGTPAKEESAFHAFEEEEFPKAFSYFRSFKIESPMSLASIKTRAKLLDDSLDVTPIRFPAIKEHNVDRAPVMDEEWWLRVGSESDDDDYLDDNLDDYVDDSYY